MLYALIDYSHKKSLSKIEIEEVLGEVKIILPRFKERYTKKVAKKVIKTMNHHKVDHIILSRELSQNEDFCNEMEDGKKFIITGRRMTKVMLNRMLDEIATYAKYPQERMDVLLLMNEYSLENMELIEIISKKVRQLHIISRNYTKYERCATSLFENYGFMIKLYPNDYEGEFHRVNLIINMDFKEEEVQKIAVSKNCILISLNEKIEKIKRGFQGIIVNDIDMAGFDERLKNFRTLAVCEAKVYKPLRKIRDNERIFNQEKYIINGYIGTKGKVTQEEFEKVGKNFT